MELDKIEPVQRQHLKLWIPKHLRFSPAVFDRVVQAISCPCQRKFRRLSRAERIMYERRHQLVP